MFIYSKYTKNMTNMTINQNKFCLPKDFKINQIYAISIKYDNLRNPDKAWCDGERNSFVFDSKRKLFPRNRAYKIETTEDGTKQYQLSKLNLYKCN